MSELAELQRRSDELARLGQETTDDQLRNILIHLSREFKQAAEQIESDEQGYRLSRFVPWFDET
jgi:hypothetical protein